jgi:hypothetical protein
LLRVASSRPPDDVVSYCNFSAKTERQGRSKGSHNLQLQGVQGIPFHFSFAREECPTADAAFFGAIFPLTWQK